MNDDNPSATAAPEGEARVVDPSDAVTGMGFVLGAVGAIVGVVAALVLTPSFAPVTALYCLLAGLGGASAGIVTGGMIGAIFAVARGRRPARQG
jgi:hypothetical protein